MLKLRAAQKESGLLQIHLGTDFKGLSEEDLLSASMSSNEKPPSELRISPASVCLSGLDCGLI